MAKKIIGLSFFLFMGLACYLASDAFSQMIRSKIREVAKQELIKPIKHKIKKIFGRSKVRLAMRKQRIKLNSSHL